MAPGASPPLRELLKRYRAAAGLTQEELAERAGISARAISDLERGLKQRPHAYTLGRLVQALGLEDEDRAAFDAAARPGASAGGMDEVPLNQTLTRHLATVHTFLVADMRDYTRYTNEHGDDAAAVLADRFAVICQDVVSAGGGEVIELRGDEALAVFGSPRQALRTAVVLQDRFARETECDPRLPLRVGVGLDVGEAVPVQGGYRGGALNLAARLCGIAGAGEVLCSEGVVALARKTAGIVMADRGEVRLKGLSSPVRMIQIAREGELPPDLPPLQPIDHPTNLPDEPTPFIGRAGEIAAVTDLVRQPTVRLVTLTGTGGSGKTRMALHAGNTLLHEFRDGVFGVNLAPLSDPSLVPSAIADVLGVTEVGGADLLSTLVDSLRGKHLLLILDNYEHLLDAASVVSSLLDGCRDLHVLVTSRTPLHLLREHEYPVLPRTVPQSSREIDLEQLAQYDAVALFVARARAVTPDFHLTEENASAVAEICRRLDGLPLAIELAASRLRMFPPPALLQRLGNRLSLLTSGSRDAPSRHQTLRAAIDWSYSLLSPDERTLFARLSVFAGGCTVEAADVVCTVEGELDVVEGIGSLVEHNLVRQEGGEDEPRFGMLETIKEYAGEQLTGCGEAARMCTAHAEYFTALAEQANAGLTIPRPEEAMWPSRLEREHDNLQAALRWSLQEGSELALRLASALFTFWSFRDHWTEGRSWLDAVLRSGPKPEWDRGTWAGALYGAGFFARMQGDYPRAEALYEERLRLCQEMGDRAEVAHTLRALGGTASQHGDLDRGRALTEESLRIFQELGHTSGIARALHSLGTVTLWQEDYGRATRLDEESLQLWRELEVKCMVGNMLSALGDVPLSQGDYRRALELYEECLGVWQELEFVPGIAEALAGLGYLAWRQGDYRRGRELLEQSLRLCQRAGDRVYIFDGFIKLAALAATLQEHERAVVLLGAADTIRESIRLYLDPLVRDTIAKASRATQEALSAEAYQAAWHRGQAMSLEEAVSYALAEER